MKFHIFIFLSIDDKVRKVYNSSSKHSYKLINVYKLPTYCNTATQQIANQ